MMMCWCWRPAPCPQRIPKRLRLGICHGWNPTAAPEGEAVAAGAVPLAAAGSTVKLQLVVRAALPAVTVYVPGASVARGTATIALSNCRICFAAPEVLYWLRVQVSTSPAGPRHPRPAA